MWHPRSFPLRLNLDKIVFLVFLTFVFAYTIIFLISPQLGPTDDVVFLRTLQSGKPLFYYSSDFPYYDVFQMGRFTPLLSMEYNLVGLFSNAPFWYFFYHAVQFIIFTILVVKIFKYATDNKILIYSMPVLLFLLPGFTSNWFYLQQGERNVIFFLAVFILAYFGYLRQQKNLYLFIGFLSANLAIYYKEVGFVAVGVFALANIFFRLRKIDKNLKLFNIALIVSSLSYLILYYFFILNPKKNFLYLEKPFNPFLVMIKNFFNYAFFSDPILILIAVPLTVHRLYKLLAKKDDYSIYDTLLITGTAYIFSFVVLNMYSPYYLLPAYIFFLPSLVFYLSKKTFSKLWLPCKIILAINIFLLIFNVIPASMHFLTLNKYLPINFNKTLNFLINDIQSRHPKDRANIFIDGTDSFTRKDAHFILAEFLLFKGLSAHRFDLKPLEKISYYAPDWYKIKHPFTVFKKDEPSSILKGDYLIVPPYTISTKNADGKYIQSLKKDYKLVFYTQSKLAFPNINLKTVIKYFMIKSMAGKEKGIIVNENLMQLPDYYVFIKK